MNNDDNWLEEKRVACSSCGEQLFLLETSPFNNGYYFYCSKCPKRVDISIYDNRYSEVEKQYKKKLTGKDDHESFFTFLNELARNLLPCPCGGGFSHDNTRRCLFCGNPIPECPDHMDVWLPNFGMDGEDEVPCEYRDFVLEAKWKGPPIQP